MLAGQGDNTICYYNERVDKKMGSHASQLAKAVCIFSPLQYYGVQQITSAMSLNWSFSTMSPLSGMKRGCFTQRSATIPVNIAANNGFAIHISPVK